MKTTELVRRSRRRTTHDGSVSSGMRFVVAVVAAALVVPAVAKAGTVFLLDGRGWGHGVGMSQWGAEGYARHGYSYARILAHYYPHTQLARVQPRTVRVLLEENQRSVRVGSAAPFVVVDARGRKLHLPARSVVVDSRFVLRHLSLRPPLEFEPGAQPLQVDFAGYRGDVVVKRKPGGLMVVNTLPLDRYLRGVVPWEAPAGWHTATYEAQAVAARSYTLAMLKPGEDFDLYSDSRSQMYGGIRAERPETNVAIGATAGRVLEWRGQIIPAYYFSSSGGRTSSIHDAWPKMTQVPYLVSVRDPYDYLSPHHVWPTEVLTAARVEQVLGVPEVRDMQVIENSSGRASAVRVLGAHGWRRFSAQVITSKFQLGSTNFEVRALSLDATAASAQFGARVHVTGFLRGLGRARLQELGGAGWTTIRSVHPAANGRFSVAVEAVRSTELRLAYNGLAGDAVTLRVVPRVVVDASGSTLRVRVAPSLPLRIERLTRREWRPVATSRGTFTRRLGPGSYRVAVPGGGDYLPAVSRPVALRP
jgi:SpoIID/LytB domain protein